MNPSHNKSLQPMQASVTHRPFDYWLKKNWYYHQQILNFHAFVIPHNSTILHINCSNGYVLNALKPKEAVGIDSDAACIKQAQTLYPNYAFYCGEINDVSIQNKFEYIILSLSTMQTDDIQDLLMSLQKFCNPQTRIIVEHYSYLWEPMLDITRKLRLRRPTRLKNWISKTDLENFLMLGGFETITHHRYLLMPFYIPLISNFLNTFFIHIPFMNRLALQHSFIAKPLAQAHDASSLKVSVIIPCRNERGNIEPAILRTPLMGKEIEIIFVEGNSHDGTLEEVQRIIEKYPEKNIRLFKQDGKGKGDAVRKGFAHAQGDILMILDADLTVPPEDLPKFFNALVEHKGEFINGSRLVYGMESGAMRFLNMLANYFFSVLFSWLLNQRVKDTLCGTKVLWKRDYEKIVDNRHFFGNFDPFGDFDLLFGAAKLNLKIIDMPIHYKSRTYGETQIRRFYHGWILLGMSLLAAKKFKFR